MITFSDVRNDLRIRKEADSLRKRHEVVVISNIRSLPAGPFEHEGLPVINVRLITRGLPRSPVFWVAKYAEFVVRSVWTAIRLRADAYHGHDLIGAVPALLAAKCRRAKLVYDAHELDADRSGFIERTWWLRRLMLWCLRRVMRRADHVICASESRADIMLREYGARERPTPILNVTPRAGMPSRADSPPRISGVDLSGKRVVIYQGTLADGRGLPNAVAALRHLPGDVVLMIVGSGAAESALLEQAGRDHTHERLIMTGRVPADALVSYMKLADVGLTIYRNTCRNNYHCAPNKIFEYASVGLPVAAPRFPDIVALVEGHPIGTTFDPEDAADIARAIRDVLEDPERYKTMSAAAADLKESINWEQQEEQLFRIYERIL